MAWFDPPDPDFFTAVAQILPLNYAPDEIGGAANTLLGQTPSAWPCYVEPQANDERVVGNVSVVNENDVYLFGPTDPGVQTEQIIQVTVIDGNTLPTPRTYTCEGIAKDMSSNGVLWRVKAMSIK